MKCIRCNKPFEQDFPGQGICLQCLNRKELKAIEKFARTIQNIHESHKIVKRNIENAIGIKKLKEKIVNFFEYFDYHTVMIIPHHAKKIYHLQISPFTLSFWILSSCLIFILSIASIIKESIDILNKKMILDKLKDGVLKILAEDVKLQEWIKEFFTISKKDYLLLAISILVPLFFSILISWFFYLLNKKSLASNNDYIQSNFSKKSTKKKKEVHKKNREIID